MKWVAGISLFLCVLSSFAQDERKEVFVTQIGRVSDEPAIKDLPPHLKPEPGKFSLLADFQNQKEGRVIVYLVNATKKPTLLPKQDGDIYCKREAKGKDGEWRRCDSHEYSWCGNSYGFVEVKAGGFISWEQKLDSKGGKPRPMRFRLFNGAPVELETNEGLGKVTDEDMRFCRYDSMAMSYGPFEDVAAVATGEVKGSQGSSMGGNSGIRALQRFVDEETLFPVLKKVVAHLLMHPNEEHSHTEYDDCLGVLAKTMGRTVSPQEAFDYVVGHVNDPKFPWSGLAMDWLVLHFERKWREMKDVAEKVLSQPEHKALRSALHAYSKLAEKDEAGLRLETISKDKRYPKDLRDYASMIRDKLFVNPYLRVQIEQDDPFVDVLQPLKAVTIVNISPQTISLPVEKAEDLIFVRMVGNDEGGTREPVAGLGQIQLKPGEKIVLHDVPWWRGIDPAKLKKDKKDPFEGEKPSFSFILHAATPGLWNVPAEGQWISVDGDKLLKVLQNKP